MFAADLRLLEPMKPVTRPAEVGCTETRDDRQSYAGNQEQKSKEILCPTAVEAPVAVSDDVAAGNPLTSKHLDFLEEQELSDRKASPSQSVFNVSKLEEELLSDLQVPDAACEGGKTVFEGEKILQTLLSKANMSSLASTPAAAAVAAPMDAANTKHSSFTSSARILESNCFKRSNGSPTVIGKGSAVAASSTLNGGSEGGLSSSKCKVTSMSAEAAQILDELPILSFLRSNLL